MTFLSRTLKIAMLFYFFVGLWFFSNAQRKGEIYYHLTTAHGLSSNNITAVIQDREGFYWIATNNGLNRFDGTNIKVFYNNSRDTNSLSHNHCTTLLEDNNGDIWVGTLYGLNCYRKKENRFIRVFLRHPDYVTDRLNWISSLKIDKDGDIWIGTFGLWRYKIKEKILEYFFSNPGSAQKIFEGQTIELIYEPASDGIWGSASTGFFYFDRKQKIFHYKYNNDDNRAFFNLPFGTRFIIDSSKRLWYTDILRNRLCYYEPANDKISETFVYLPSHPRDLFVDDKNRVWLLFWQKPAMIYDHDNYLIDSGFLAPVHSKSPLTHRLSHLFIESDEKYWLCSSEGISIYDKHNQNKNYISLPISKTTGRPVIITEICRSYSDSAQVWLRSNEGIFRLDMGSLTIYKINEPAFNKNITGLVAHGDSILFVCTIDEVLRYNHILRRIERKENGFLITRANMLTDQQRNVWVATWSNGLYKLDYNLRVLKHFSHRFPGGDTSLAGDHIINISSYQSGQRYFLAGYNSGKGFAEIYTFNDSVVNFRMPQDDLSESMVANTINCLEFDKKGQLWLGTFGGGLYVRDLTGKYRNINQSDGLKSNFVNAIFSDSHSNLWVSTADGLNIIQNDGNTIINPGNEIRSRGNDFRKNCMMLANGNILAFDDNKMIIYYPKKTTSFSRRGKILISEFRIFGQHFSLPETGKNLSLHYNQNFFSFDFSLLKSDSEEEVQYAYMLKGFDKDWVLSRNKNVAAYTNVPPGHYELLIKAAGQDGRWIHYSTPLKINITPPFWRTIWFYSLCILALISGIYIFYNYRIRQLKKLLKLRTKISQDLHDEVGATLSGIAMYSHLTKEQIKLQHATQIENSLNVIQQSATDMVTKLSDIVWVVDPKHDSLEKLMRRLNEYATEIAMVKNIRVRTDVSEKIAGLKLPMESRKNIYLMCKEAVNNSVKYSECSLIQLKIDTSDHTIGFEVSDNGKGFNLDKVKLGNGLVNMQQRAEEIGGELKIISVEGSGTRIILKYKIT